MNQSFGFKKGSFVIRGPLVSVVIPAIAFIYQYTHFYRLRSVLYQKTFKVALTLLPKYVNVI